MLCFICVANSCKKKEAEVIIVPNPSPVGFWKGRYGLGSNPPIEDVCMRFEKNGFFYVYNGSDTITATSKGSGFWELSGEIMSFNYTYTSAPTSIFRAYLVTNDSFKTSEGYWGIKDNSPIGFEIKGIMTLTKQ